MNTPLFNFSWKKCHDSIKINLPISKILRSVVLITVFAVACNSDTSSNKELIESFVVEVLIENPMAANKTLGKYLGVKENDEELYGYIKAVIPKYHESLRDVNNFEIIDFNESQLLTKLVKKDIDYINKNKIYYLIVDNRIEMFFIVDDAKIISFFPNITKGVDNDISPFIFSK